MSVQKLLGSCYLLELHVFDLDLLKLVRLKEFVTVRTDKHNDQHINDYHENVDIKHYFDIT